MLAPTPVHWTTYLQTFAGIASTIGTFVYVYYTYHIMKRTVDESAARRAAVDDKVRSLLVEILLASWLPILTRGLTESGELSSQLDRIASFQGSLAALRELNLRDDVREGLTAIQSYVEMLPAVRRAVGDNAETVYVEVMGVVRTTVSLLQSRFACALDWPAMPTPPVISSGRLAAERSHERDRQSSGGSTSRQV
jgi:hypothetical protein